MALGASPGDVVRLVLHNGTRLVLIGAGIGVLGTLATGRVLATMLFGVGAADPITIVAVVLLLIAVATLAAWWPARRAGKVDPMVALGR
jgi:ABC-type antimicrobial peptide transport system permease subunit